MPVTARILASVAAVAAPLLALSGHDPQAQPEAATLAPDASVTLQSLDGPVPAKALDLVGQTPGGHNIQLRRTYLEDFSHFHLSASDTDATGWKTHYPYNSYEMWQGRTLYGNGERQIYVDPGFKGAGGRALGFNPFSVDNGILSITAQPISPNLMPALTFPATADGKFGVTSFKYTSGLLTTYKTFYQTYGYFEFNADIPRQAGTWPAFWMLPEAVKWPPEIDVMEVNNRQPQRPADQGTLAVHMKVNGANDHDGCYIHLDPGFHTYGMLWTADRITYYTDRQPTCTVRTPDDMHEAMYLILQLAMANNATVPGPVSLKVRWVAAYSIADPTGAISGSKTVP